MGGILGGKKTGGRTKGTPNSVTKTAQELADKLGVNPFEVLLRLTANDWKNLGYDARERSVVRAGGFTDTEDSIPIEMRFGAAKEACKYLLPQRKAIEHTGADGKDFFQSFAQVMGEVRKIKESSGQ